MVRAVWNTLAGPANRLALGKPAEIKGGSPGPVTTPAGGLFPVCALIGALRNPGHQQPGAAQAWLSRDLGALPCRTGVATPSHTG